MQDDAKQQDVVLITGASSGIGLAIARKLCREGRNVYGIGRNFSAESAGEWDGQFHPVACDLLDTGRLLATIAQIRAKARINVLINNAGTAYYGLHESLTTAEIQEILRTDLEVPMLLTREFLPAFKQHQGTFIFISSATALHTENPHGAAYAAAKTGLLSFARSIFAESRRSGVRVTTILPDMTRTALYRHADFDADPAPGASLSPDDVANAISYVLAQPDGVCIPEIALTPQFHRIYRKP